MGWDLHWAVWLNMALYYLGVGWVKVCKASKAPSMVGFHTFDCFYAAPADFVVQVGLVFKKHGFSKGMENK